MSDRFFHGYWRLKKEKANLQHELEQRAEYAQDLEAQIIVLEKRVQPHLVRFCDMCEDISLEEYHYVFEQDIECLMCGKQWKCDE